MKRHSTQSVRPSAVCRASAHRERRQRGARRGETSSTIGYSQTLRDALRLYGEGKTKEALEAQAKNAELCSFFAQYESQAKNVQKALMKAVGMDVGPSRLPKLDLSEGDLELLSTKLDAKGFLDKP